MTASDLVRGQIDNAAFQLSKTLEGVSEDQLDTKPTSSMMSIREQAAHLCEVYTAAGKIAIGESHAWGTYQPPASSWSELTDLLWSLRTKATDALLAADTDEALREASSYIVEHDNYHIGQLAATRIVVDPSWDPYSLYRP
jgi:uncharacterized damage-inducible protein DinB